MTIKTPGTILQNLLQSISEATNQPSQPASEEKEFVEENFERAIKTEDLKLRKEVYELAKQNRTERKKYAWHIFIVTCIWATLIFMIVIANGLKSINGKQYFTFEISDKVMITLITSTTLNFFGFFLLVVKYLFHVSHLDIPKSSAIKKKKSESNS